MSQRKLEQIVKYGASNPKQRGGILWALNRAALQKQIDRGVDFDYSLTSITKIQEYEAEVEYVKLLESGNYTEVLRLLGGKSLPARLKEIQLLLDAGYTPRYDDVTQVIHWTLDP